MKLLIFLATICLAQMVVAMSNGIDSPEAETHETMTPEPTNGMRPTLARCAPVGRYRTKSTMEPSPMAPTMAPEIPTVATDTTKSGGTCEVQTKTGNSADPNSCGFFQCVPQPDGTFEALPHPCQEGLCYNFEQDACVWK